MQNVWVDVSNDTMFEWLPGIGSGDSSLLNHPPWVNQMRPSALMTRSLSALSALDEHTVL